MINLAPPLRAAYSDHYATGPSAPPADAAVDPHTYANQRNVCEAAAALADTSVRLRATPPNAMDTSRFGAYMARLTEFTHDVNMVVPDAGYIHANGQNALEVAGDYLHYYRTLQAGHNSLAPFAQSSDRNAQLVMLQESATYKTLLNMTAMKLSQARERLQGLITTSEARPEHRKAIADIDDVFGPKSSKSFADSEPNVILRTPGEGAGPIRAAQPVSGGANSQGTHNPAPSAGANANAAKNAGKVPPWVLPSVLTAGAVAVVALTVFLIIHTRRAKQRKRIQAALAQRNQQFGVPAAQVGGAPPLAQVIGPAGPVPVAPMPTNVGMPAGVQQFAPYGAPPMPNAPNFNNMPGVSVQNVATFDPLQYYATYGTQGGQ